MSTFLQRLFPPPPSRPIVPPGIYHQMQADQSTAPRRLHLRVEPDGRGLLIVNASTVLHLNETATGFAWQFVQGKGEAEAAEWMTRRYRLARRRARRDAQLLHDQIQSIAEGDDLDPVLVMGLERTEPHQIRPSAPFRLDLALTFRLAGRSVDPLARRRVRRELSTKEWTAVLEQAWSVGIPHVVFVGGEPTVRPDLPDLIRRAEHLGQVSGVVASGERLAAPGRLEELAAAGLDHLMVLTDPTSKKSLEGLRLAVACEIFCAAHLTLDPASRAKFGTALDKVRATGVTHISLSAPAGPRTAGALERAQRSVSEAGLTLVWDLPVPHSRQNPIRLEAGLAPEAGAWLYVEPDGDVLISAGSDKVLGNLRRDSIADLWQRAGAEPAAAAA